jgi:hypothetical protein
MRSISKGGRGKLIESLKYRRFMCLLILMGRGFCGWSIRGMGLRSSSVMIWVRSRFRWLRILIVSITFCRLGGLLIRILFLSRIIRMLNCIILKIILFWNCIRIVRLLLLLMLGRGRVSLFDWYLLILMVFISNGRIVWWYEH